MLFKRQKFDWLLVVFVAVGLFLYASYQPRFRLRPDVPPDFVDTPVNGSWQRPSAEEKIARAYWTCLVEDIQWEYGYGHTLPIDPPPDFTAMEGSGMTSEDAANRIRYWHRAQPVWYLPTTWKKDYEWDFNWTTDWIQHGGDALHHFFQHLGGG